MSSDNRKDGLQTGATAGVTLLNVASNLVYAGLRAQNNPDRLARFFTFLFGFPGTLLTYFVVDEGSERAYGVDLPRKRWPWSISSIHLTSFIYYEFAY